MHLFDVANRNRPATSSAVRMFGWSQWLLRFMMKRLGPPGALQFFGDRTHVLQDYLPPNYRADSASSKVGRYVHIQVGWQDADPMDPVGETQWLSALDDPPDGIVAYADLELGSDVGVVLAGHRAASERVRGVRHMLSWHADPGVMSFTHRPEVSRRSAFRAGFEQLAEHDFSFDAWCYSDQLPEVCELAAFCPDVPIVLCHAGTPIGLAGEFQGVGRTAAERESISLRWRDHISAVAEHPHVHCKLSGLLMPVVGFGYEAIEGSPSVSELAERLEPLLVHCLDAFGEARCMFASNFPVDRVSCDYETLVKAILQITKSRGPTVQQALFADNAAHFYRISNSAV